MEEWPKDNKTAHFDDLTQPLVKAVKLAYQIKRKNRDKDIEYTGLPLTTCKILAGCPNISERLSANSLQYNEDEQGREAIEVIIGCAVQLGIEQGLRMARSDAVTTILVLKSIISIMESDV